MRLETNQLQMELALVVELDLSQVVYLQDAEVEVIHVSVGVLDLLKDVVIALLVSEVDLDRRIDIAGLDLVVLDQVIVGTKAEAYLKIDIEGHLQDLTGDDEVGLDPIIGVTGLDPITDEVGPIRIVDVVDPDQITGGVDLGRIIVVVDLDQNVDAADHDQFIELIIRRVHIVEIARTKEIIETKLVK